ncbi:MAG: hypothetical protein NTW90_06310 [Nitrosospira sp.]|nr:hypothetical protein [Nitrosospira sp.]
MLFIEFLTSNLFSFQWPNRQHYFLDEISAGAIARAYGFGGNATVTSVLVISLTTILYQGYIRDFLTLSLAVSATGWIALLAKFILKQRRLITLILVLPIAILALSFSGDAANAIDYPALHRLSINYFLYIGELKLNQIYSVIGQIDSLEFYVGQSLRDSDLRSGDFQALDFFVFNGLIGTILFLLFVLTRISKKNYISVILLLIGTIHYQIIFSLSGQIIFAWILTLTKSDHLATVTTNK